VLILVGGGIDMSRAYMTQTSLQNACDAGVLAGRRAQAKSGTWSTAEQQKAQRMFTFNFLGTASSANASSTTFTPANAGSGVISGSATTTIPTAIMQIFGTPNFTLTATCSAEFQLSNIDVMMVLDTTGSMEDNPDGTNCYPCTTSKIEGLKSAIRSFYYTLAASVPAGGTTRVRFGFTPYNGSVNIRNLVASGDIPSSYLTSSTNYQTRLAWFNTAVNNPSTGPATPTTETYGSAISQSDCNNYATNDYPTSGSNPVTTGTAPANVTTVTYSFGSWAKTGTTGSGKNKTDVGTCVRNVSTTTTTYTTAYKLSGYRYTQDAVDTSTLKTLAATTIATGLTSSSTVPTAGYYDMVQLGSLAGTTNVTTGSLTWGGCVEERSSVNSLIAAGSIPSGATDLDLASAPAGDSTRWHPYIAELVYDRGQTATLDLSAGSSQIASTTDYCPPAAQKLTTVDTSAPTTVPSWIETYLASLYPWGGTYHDIGMIWGARLANPNGIMAANVNAGNLTSVSRHIIFLTDGAMSPYKNVYSAYGVEYLDNRVAPSANLNSTAYQTYLTPYHNGRFLAACQRAKDMGYTVWLIGFGQTLTTEMTACASGGRAFYASDTTTLQSTFRQIAAQVADLRLKS